MYVSLKEIFHFGTYHRNPKKNIYIYILRNTATVSETYHYKKYTFM